MLQEHIEGANPLRWSYKNTYMRLEEFFKKYARKRGVTVAEEFAKRLRQKVGKQAPIRRTRSGRVVATTSAIPFAPPRRVTGRLQRSIKVVRTAHGARVVIWAPYSVPLEKSRRWWGWPHAFVSVVLREMDLSGRHG